MAFTYSLSTDRGKVRLRIGDTVSQNYSLSDEEVDHALDLTAKVDFAAVLAHEWFIARLADYITSSAGGQSKQLQQKFEHHQDIHKRLVKRAGKGQVNIYAGGIEQDRIDDAKEDTNYPYPSFSVGMDDRDYDPTPETED